MRRAGRSAAGGAGVQDPPAPQAARRRSGAAERERRHGRRAESHRRVWLVRHESAGTHRRGCLCAEDRAVPHRPLPLGGRRGGRRRRLRGGSAASGATAAVVTAACQVAVPTGACRAVQASRLVVHSDELTSKLIRVRKCARRPTVELHAAGYLLRRLSDGGKPGRAEYQYRLDPDAHIAGACTTRRLSSPQSPERRGLCPKTNRSRT